MGSIVLLRNPLAPHSREVYPVADGMPVINWLQLNYPQGFGMPCRFYMNGKEEPLDNLDMTVGSEDVAAIALMPGDPGSITLSAILVQLAISAVLAGASMALNYFFQPKDRSGPKGKPVSIYELASDQNGARLGEAIPVLYGTVLTSPDYITQPYTYFDWDQSLGFVQKYNGIQYLNLVLCVGQGNIDVTDLYLGDTSAKTPPTDVVQWKVFKPADHKKTMGTIAAAMGPQFHENVITSPEVSNQEFLKKNDTAGYFASCKPGQQGKIFEIDILFPGGQTNPDSKGDVDGRTTTFTVYWVELNDNDQKVGSEASVNITATTEKGGTHTTYNLGSNRTSGEKTENRSELGAPIRKTYRITAAKSARWAVKIVRTSDAPNSKNGSDRFLWTGLKLFADYSAAGTAYGDVTLVAARIKASQGIGNDASVRLRVKATRRLSPPGGGAEVATNSAAYAFADVYTNPVYGAARPQTEIDVDVLKARHTAWGSTYQFNYVFSERTTVWNALQTITTPFGAEPLPVGPVMSIVQDGTKAVRSMLFTDANIVANTMAVNYSWDEENATDGVEIEYADPLDFRPVYARYPASSVRPDQFSLPGVTNATHAAQYARLVWQRRQLQRKRISFDTELEGLLLQLGDRIGVSHNVPKWGDGGLVIARSGNILTVDHNLDWSGASKQILLRKPDGSPTDPINVIRGAADNKVVMQSPPAVTVNFDNDYEYTSFAFGTSTTLVRDFMVTTTTPNSDNTVTVEAVNYNTAVFTGAMSYMS